MRWLNVISQNMYWSKLISLWFASKVDVVACSLHRFVQLCKENVLSESYEAIVPLYSLLVCFFPCLLRDWVLADHLRLYSCTYHHRLLVNVLRHHLAEAWLSKLLINHCLLVKRVRHLTEYLLLQLDWLLCQYIEFVFFVWKLMRTCEWFLSWVSTASSFLFSSFVFIFFW